MIRTIITLVILFSLSFSVFAKPKSKKVNTKAVIEAIFKYYDSAEYRKALSGLDKIQQNVVSHAKNREDIQGLVYYWKGLCFVKLTEYEKAIVFLKKAIDLKFDSKDIFYEYGQVLYAMDEMKKARFAFKRSVENNFKRGVSLYYIAYISQELKDYKKAVSFYNAIEKLEDEEKEDVIQAARMQVGDIYLKQIEKMPDSFRSVEKYVIPQYEKALAWNKNSKLAEQIKDKIIQVQKRYDLLLFKMRNGVPTAVPRHFLRASMLYGVDDNITNSDEDTKATLEEKDYSSAYTTAALFGRYSFYPNSSYSIAPEFSFDYTNHLSDSDTLKAYNTMSYRVGFQINYEHMYNNSPATLYINVDQTTLQDDADADDKLEAASATSSIQISEGLQFWAGNPTTLRYRYSQTTAQEESESFSTHTLTWEQLLNRGALTLFLFNSFDINRYPETESSNTNVYTFRGDWIWPTIFGLINPNLFASARLTNYIEDEDRGVTNLVSYGASLNRPFGRKWYLTIDYVSESQTAEQDSDVHQGTRYSINLDYIY